MCVRVRAHTHARTHASVLLASKLYHVFVILSISSYPTYKDPHVMGDPGLP